MTERPERGRPIRILALALAALASAVSAAAAPVRTVSLAVAIANEAHPDADACDDMRNQDDFDSCHDSQRKEAHLRITVGNRGRTIARRGDLLIEVTSNAPVSIAGRRGFGSCTTAPPLRCVNTLQLGSFGDEASVLVVVRADKAPGASGTAGEGASAEVRVTVRPGPGVERTLRITGTTSARASVPNPYRRASPTNPPIQAPVQGAPTAAPASWAGTWKWKSTRTDTKQVFEAQPMTIAESGSTACANWTFAGGGRAKGSLVDGKWSATWSDPYSSGGWELRLQGPDRFTGTQTRTDNATKVQESYAVEGTRLSQGATLDCATVRP